MTRADLVMGDLLPEDAKDKMAAIKALDVVCTKEMMNVSMQFDKDFGGVIYSKVSYAAARWAVLQQAEPCYSKLSHAAASWAMLQQAELHAACWD